MIDKLPYGWEVVQIGQVAQLINGYSQFNSKSYVDNGIPIFRIGDLGGHVNLSGVKRVPKDIVPNLNQKCLFRGDILIAKIGKRVGVSSVYNSDEPAILSSQVAGVRARRIDPKFLACFIESSFFYDAIKPHFFGSTRDNISPNRIRLTSIPFPPLPTQRKIAVILGTYDDLIENNTRRIEILEEMAQAIYREWFIEFRFPGHEGLEMVESELGLIPQGWEIKQLGEVAHLHRGKSYRSQNLVEEGEGLPFLNLKNINREGGFRTDGLKWYDGKFQETQIATSNDIIMALTDMTQERRVVARSARVPNLEYEKYVFSMDLVKIKPKESIQTDFLCALLQYSNLAEHLKEYANGTTVLHLSPSHVQSSELILPPRELRQRYAEIAESIHQQSDLLQKKNTNLRQTRDLLLPKLISGEIDVSELEIDADRYHSQKGE